MSHTIGTVYDDGDYSLVQPVSLPELSAPIPGIRENYILAQDFQQAEASYVPAQLSTPYPIDAGTGGVTNGDAHGNTVTETWAGSTAYNTAGFILVSEGPLRDQGGGVVQWTRKYARVPATHYDPITVAYQFPGLITFNPLETVIRAPFTRTVPGIVEYHYIDAGTNSYSSLQSIESANYVPEQIYYWPQATSYVVSDFAKRVDSLWENTVPTAATYASWIVSGAHPIVAQPSSFERWNGNILLRKVVTIQPQ